MTEELLPEDRNGISPAEEAYLIQNVWNDPAAFTRLYMSYIHPIYRYIFSKVSDPRESEDLTAQVFLEALESLPRYHHDGHFSAWLFSIARHKVIDHYRSRRPNLPIDLIHKEPSIKSDPLSTLIRTEETHRMTVLIHKLDEQEQELLRLRFVAEMKFGDIARLIHSSMETTKKRVYRLLAHLRQELEQNHDR